MKSLFFNLLNHKGLIRYAKNTSWLLFERVFRIIVGLLVGAWMARYLGPGDFGLYSYTISFVGLFAIFATLGLDAVLVKELVNKRNKANELITTGLFLRILASALVVISIFFISNNYLVNESGKKLILIASASIIFQSFNIIDLYLQSKVLAKYTAYINSGAVFLSSLIKVFLIVLSLPLEYFVYLLILDALIIALGYIYIFFFVSVSDSNVFNLSNLNFRLSISILKKSWPIFLSTIFVTIYTKIDQIMIMQFLGSDYVGQYAVALKFSESWYFIPSAIATSLFPAIISAKEVSEKLYLKRLKRLYGLMIYTSTCIALFITIFGDFFINILFGKQYLGAINLLVIHIWAGISVFIGNVSTRWMINEGFQAYAAIYAFIGASTNVALNYVLLPKIGVEGAAIATLISYFLANFFCLLIFKKTRPAFFQIAASIYPK